MELRRARRPAMTGIAKDLVERYLLDVVGNRDLETLDRILADDAVVYGPTPGSRSTGRSRYSLADYPENGSVTVLELVAEDDRVAARWMMTPRSGEAGAEDPGQTLRALSVFWIESGLIRKGWTGIRAGELWVN